MKCTCLLTAEQIQEAAVVSLSSLERADGSLAYSFAFRVLKCNHSVCT